MIKRFIVGFALISANLLFSQVGVGTATPKATLDVVAKKTDGTTSEGIIAPRMTGDQIKSANSKYGSDQTGALVYATSGITSADPTGKASDITSAGYFYFDGAEWVGIKSFQIESTDATRFLGGTVYAKFDYDSEGTLSNAKVIGGGNGNSYNLGSVTQSSSKGGINSLIGEGYTISNPSNGIFDILFNVPLTEIYGISINIVDAYGYNGGNQGGSIGLGQSPDATVPGSILFTDDNAQVSFISDSILRVKTGNSAGTLSNRSFTFLVTGK